MRKPEGCKLHSACSASLTGALQALNYLREALLACNVRTVKERKETNKPARYPRLWLSIECCDESCEQKNVFREESCIVQMQFDRMTLSASRQVLQRTRYRQNTATTGQPTPD